MLTYLENRGRTERPDGTIQENSKFYEVEVGDKTIFRWGKTDEYGQLKGKTEGRGVKIASATPDEALAEKQIKDKLRGGYVVIHRVDGGKLVKVENRPYNDPNARTFGVEVETHSNLDISEIVKRLRERGLSVSDRRDQYFHSDGSGWDVKRDGSCGYEFASPILQSESGLFDVKLAVEKIMEVCPDATDRNCGLHVTVSVKDYTDTDIRRFLILYLRGQEHFYAQCAKSRQSNRFCKRNPLTHLLGIVLAEKKNGSGSTVDTLVSSAGGYRSHDDRYHGVNFTRLFSKRLIEFRMMESTTDCRKVGRWVSCCVGFVNGVKHFAHTLNLTSMENLTEEEFGKLTKLGVTV